LNLLWALFWWRAHCPRLAATPILPILPAAYDALPADLKQDIEGLRAVHSNTHLYGENGLYRMTDLADQLGGMDRVGDATHPVVILHPESGRKVPLCKPRPHNSV
jgi:taurine dioxygenase